MDSTRPDRPPEDEAHGRRTSERVIVDFVKRVIETGVGKLADSPENLRSFVADLKLPKEIANYLLAQIEETKNGLHRVVASEIRSYLEKSNLADDLAKALERMAIEIKTEIRFVPDGAEPRVRSTVAVKPDERSESDVPDARPTEPGR